MLEFIQESVIMWKALVVLAVAANNFLKTTGQCTNSTAAPSPSDICAANALEAFILGNFDFTAKLLDGQLQLGCGNDAFVGGAAVLVMMAELALYASNATSQQILSAMRLNNTEQIECFFGKFLVEVKRKALEVDLDFNTFSKIYADYNYPLYPEFKNEIEVLFTVRPDNLDFSAPNSAQEINNEVAQNTDNSIVNFIDPETLSSLNSLVMLDAFNFKGEWLKPFDPIDTELQYFYGPTNIVRKLIMHQRDTFLYTDSQKLGAQIVKLLYKADPDFKLAFLLPRTIHGVPDLLNRMKNGDDAAEAFDALREQKVDVYVPKFKVKVANLLKVPSKIADISLIFNNSTAGLENIASCGKPYVSEILQRLTYQIDEFGTGRASGSPLPEQKTSQASDHHVPVFRANRPFIYYLFYRRILLVAGTITQ